MRSVLLTFSGPEVPKIIRDGKRNWREAAANFLNQARDPHAVGMTTEVNFLLPRFYRLGSAALFLVLGVASVLAPALTIHR
jgi:hypothetical protein